MRTEYAIEVLNSIDSQEFYNDVIDFADTEVFDDILDFMQIFCPEWYKNLGTWASEFIQHHISCYVDLYNDPELSRKDILASLYWDLSKSYNDYYSSYMFNVMMQEAYQFESNIDEIID